MARRRFRRGQPHPPLIHGRPARRFATAAAARSCQSPIWVAFGVVVGHEDPVDDVMLALTFTVLGAFFDLFGL